LCVKGILGILAQQFWLAWGGYASFFPEDEEISTPPPFGLLIGIYLFYKNWSTETFRKEESKKRAVCNVYKSALLK